MSIVLLNRDDIDVLYGNPKTVTLEPLEGYAEQFFAGNYEIDSDEWEVSSGIWSASMPQQDGLESTRYSPRVCAIVPLKLYVETDISFKAKTTFGDKTLASYITGSVYSGGTFAFAVCDATGAAELARDANLSNITVLGGWNDWQTIELTLQPGNWFLYFECAHAFLVSSGSWTGKWSTDSINVSTLPWGDPGVETPTYEAFVKDFTFSPDGVVPYKTGISTGTIGGTCIEPETLTTATLGITANEIGGFQGAGVQLSTKTLGITAEVVAGAGATFISNQTLGITANNLRDYWGAIAGTPGAATGYARPIKFLCYLSDLELPISSFQARLRNSEPTYLAVVVPNIDQYESDILARKTAELSILYAMAGADGITYNYRTFVTVDFDYLRVDKGSTSRSGTIIGYRTTTNGSSVTNGYKLPDVSYISATSNGTLRVRCSVWPWLTPGDTCIYNDAGNTFVVDQINYIATPILFYMEVME